MMKLYPKKVTICCISLFSLWLIFACKNSTQQLKEFSSGLVGYWSFDEARRSFILDHSHSSNDAIINQIAMVKGKFGMAILFNGKNNVISFEKTETLSFQRKPFTIAGWFFPENPEGTIVGYGGAWVGFSLYVHKGMYGFIIKPEKNMKPVVLKDYKKRLRHWTHVAVSVNDNEAVLYIDGKSVDRKGVSLLRYLPGQGLDLGFDTGDSAAAVKSFYKGLCDELRIYNRSLDGPAVNALFNYKPPASPMRVIPKTAGKTWKINKGLPTEMQAELASVKGSALRRAFGHDIYIQPGPSSVVFFQMQIIERGNYSFAIKYGELNHFDYSPSMRWYMGGKEIIKLWPQKDHKLGKGPAVTTEYYKKGSFLLEAGNHRLRIVMNKVRPEWIDKIIIIPRD